MREAIWGVREADMKILMDAGMSHKEAVMRYVAQRPGKRAPDLEVVTFIGRDFDTFDFDDVDFDAPDFDPSATTTEKHCPATTMGELLMLDGVSVEDYLAPTRIKGAAKKDMPDKIGKFNAILDQMFAEPIHSKPFTVRIRVGDLKGFGDVTAGAKLAKELKNFYDRFKGWKDVTLQLYLHKVEMLRENEDRKSAKKRDEDSKLIEKLKAMVERIIGEAHVQLVNFEEAPTEADVTVSYPAHNIDGDVEVQQYGYRQLSSESPFGSGPGFGALGVLSIDPQLQDQAVALADDPADSVNLRIVEGLCRAYKVRQTHFAYFSTYEHSKDFARAVCTKGLAGPTAMVFARSAESLDRVAASLRSMGTVGNILKIDVVGESFNIVEHARPKVAGLPLVLLINFSDGVQNVEMLSLYYQSTGLVGATGDQSFMEAYAMRRLRHRHNEKDADNLEEDAVAEREPDILYDVTEQQTSLLRQINEIKQGEYLFATAPLGLKYIHVSDSLSDVLDSKLLLYPMVMLINKALNAKQ
jgi:hypothetical protein